VLDHTRAYKIILASALTLTLPFYIAFTYVSQQANKRGVLLAFAALVGLFGLPVLPTALDMSAETTYPINAFLTSSILWCGSQVRPLSLLSALVALQRRCPSVAVTAPTC
jgi:hypothetical protein